MRALSPEATAAARQAAEAAASLASPLARRPSIAPAPYTPGAGSPLAHGGASSAGGAPQGVAGAAGVVGVAGATAQDIKNEDIQNMLLVRRGAGENVGGGWRTGWKGGCCPCDTRGCGLHRQPSTAGGCSARGTAQTAAAARRTLPECRGSRRQRVLFRPPLPAQVAVDSLFREHAKVDVQLGLLKIVVHVLQRYGEELTLGWLPLLRLLEAASSCKVRARWGGAHAGVAAAAEAA